jgi:hypothetical protein
MKFGKLILTAVLVVFILSYTVVAKAASLAEYTPLTLDSYWTYQNVAVPSDIYTESVFEKFTFTGHQAVKKGTDANNYVIGYNDGASVGMYAIVKQDVLYDFPDVSIGTINDGMFYQLAEPSNFQLIRMWDNLDPDKKAIYNINLSLKGLILIAAYDSNYSPNYQNSVVESDLGITFPDYAVTHLEWWQAGVGLITTTDVEACSGTIWDRYDLIDYRIAPNPVPIPPTLLLLGSSMIGLIGIRRIYGRNRHTNKR